MITEKSKYFYYKKILRYLFNILFSLSHVILLLILSYIFKRNAFIVKPHNLAIFSDEVGYWREIFSFANYGFKTGYIGINELIPKVGRFSTHGFFPALFYYPFAKLLNWPSNAILISNLIFTVICFALIIFLYKPSTFQTVSLTFLYLLFPPIALFAATSMTEILNYGLLALFFMFFYKYCNLMETRNKKYFLFLTLLVGTICSLYRISYIVLFLIPVLVLSDFKFNKKFIKLFASWVLYSGLIYYINSIFTSPFPFGVLYNFTHASNLKTAVKMLILNFKFSFKNFFNLNNGNKIEIYFRFFYLIVLMLYLLLTFFKASFKKSKKDFLILSLRGKFNRFYIIQFILLFLPLFIVMTIYDIYGYRDFRTLSPFLWISFFNLIIYKRSVVLKLFTPIFLLFFMFSLFNWPQFFCINERNINSAKRDFTLIQNVIKYNESFKDPFKNTLLTDVFFDFDLWSNLHPGIGIEWIGSQLELEKCKSQYLLINQDKDIEGYEKKGSTEFGYLYEKRRLLD